MHYLLRKYLQYAEPGGKTVGMHAHNNQQLAYANTIEAIVVGANMLDGSIAGLGRGAGNCSTELLLGFLHHVLEELLLLGERLFSLLFAVVRQFRQTSSISSLRPLQGLRFRYVWRVPSRLSLIPREIWL